MTLGRSLVSTLLLAATIVLMSKGMLEAQEQAPSPRMLLNLDLFTAPPASGHSGAASDGNESTLEQLRALRSMGYLSNDGPLPNDDESDQAPNAQPHASLRSQGAQQ